MDKQAWRKIAMTVRRSTDQEAAHRRDTAIVETLIQILHTQKAQHVAIFYPMREEVDVRGIADHVTVYYPKIIDNAIVFFKDHGSFVSGPFRTTVPAHDQPTPLSMLDVVIVPGLVFDASRHRIGYGKGYYDELLTRFSGLSIGVCADDLIVDRVPQKAHDQAVDMVVSERRVLKG